MDIISWTGGSRPQKLDAIGAVERALVRHIFRDQVRTHAAYWGNCELHTCRTIWSRARHDAHATIREAVRTGAQRIY